MSELMLIVTIAVCLLWGVGVALVGALTRTPLWAQLLISVVGGYFIPDLAARMVGV